MIDRFADGWAATDVGDRPGAVDERDRTVCTRSWRSSLVVLDGQRATKVPGSFGAMGDQTAAALLRSSRDVAAVVTLRPGARTRPRRCGSGPPGGSRSEGTDGRTLTRPSWALDDAGVGRGRRHQRGAGDPGGGLQPAGPASRWTRPPLTAPVPRRHLRTAAVPGRHPGRDGHRRSGDPGEREQTPAGEFALTYPRRLGFGLGSTVISLSWRTGDDMVVTRTDPAHPVSHVNLDGVNSDGPSNNLLPPMSAVAANPSAVYVADARGVLQLSGTNGENSQTWSEVRPFMAPGTVPVLPG